MPAKNDDYDDYNYNDDHLYDDYQSKRRLVVVARRLEGSGGKL